MKHDITDETADTDVNPLNKQDWTQKARYIQFCMLLQECALSLDNGQNILEFFKKINKLSQAAMKQQVYLAQQYLSIFKTFFEKLCFHVEHYGNLSDKQEITNHIYLICRDQISMLSVKEMIDKIASTFGKTVRYNEIRDFIYLTLFFKESVFFDKVTNQDKLKHFQRLSVFYDYLLHEANLEASVIFPGYDATVKLRKETKAWGLRSIIPKPYAPKNNLILTKTFWKKCSDCPVDWILIEQDDDMTDNYGMVRQFGMHFSNELVTRAVVHFNAGEIDKLAEHWPEIVGRSAPAPQAEIIEFGESEAESSETVIQFEKIVPIKLVPKLDELAEADIDLNIIEQADDAPEADASEAKDDCSTSSRWLDALINQISAMGEQFIYPEQERAELNEAMATLRLLLANLSAIERTLPHASDKTLWLENSTHILSMLDGDPKDAYQCVRNILPYLPSSDTETASMIERCEQAFIRVWLYCVARLKEYGIDREGTFTQQSHAR